MDKSFLGKTYFFLDKVKFFGLRKFYFILIKVGNFFISLFLPLKVVFDLQFISEKESQKINNWVIKEASKIKNLVALINYGGTEGYTPGLSDIDYVFVFKKNGITQKNLMFINKILKKNSYLTYLHPPLILEDDKYDRLLIESGFNYTLNTGQYKLLYKKDEFDFKSKKKRNLNFQKNLYSIEEFFLREVAYNRIKRDLSEVGLRSILKTIKNCIFYNLKRFNKAEEKFSFLAVDNSSKKIESLRQEYKKLTEIITEKRNMDSKTKKMIIKLFNRAAKLIKLYYKKILSSEEFKQLEEIFEKKTIVFRETEHGSIIFLKDHCKRRKNVLTCLIILFSKLVQIPVFDIRMFYYLRLIDPSFKLNRKLKKKLKKLPNIAQRRKVLKDWDDFLTKNNLWCYSDLSPIMKLKII